MPPKRGTKKAAGLAQPQLSFQSRKSSAPSPAKQRAGARTKSAPLAQAASRSASASPTPTTTPHHINVDEDDGEDDTESLIRQAEAEAEDERAVSSTHKSIISKSKSSGAGAGANADEGKPKRLDVKSKEVRGLMSKAKQAMGNMEPIHAGPDTHNDVHHILRVFDMTSAYGPCVGMTRLQRWERAQKWGLNPPEAIRDILVTVEGKSDVAYRENVLHGWV